MSTVADRAVGAVIGVLERRLQGALRAPAMDALVRLRVRRVHGPPPPPQDRNSIVVVSVIRNAADTLEAFLEHYHRLGVAHIVLLDNGSTDETLEIGRRFERTTILASMLPFGASKFALRRYLLRHYAHDCWALLVDADELFDYPWSDRLGLSDLVGYLDGHGYTAVVGQMLDLFPRGALHASDYDPSRMRDEHRFFDLSGVRTSEYRFPNAVSNPAIKLHYGGVRGTALGAGDVLLSKHPLIRPGAGVSLATSHEVRGAHIADFSAVLYHYKFAGDFRAKVVDAVRQGQYYNESAEYRRYLGALDGEPNLSLRRASAEELHSVAQLVERGFLVVSPHFRAVAGTG
jgi:glycosyltransferase involved in cell wall biosynthesis